ncbi:molybdenum cofactor guanylyltransferase [Sphingomonas sp. KC8]|uniref:molybdenum cofactor guanylyltransferase n=1 Tax=Sphingomonas sp. KC8 TaxID=1030157 RepID=UPI0002488FED|nr:molybdenum cofactor guanylyltransferase [Sphingomonas sp. KC8]ARS27168.1 molybdopterin-guanine [Sphingomonas sp. KC8]
MAPAIDKAAAAPDPRDMKILGAIFAGGAARRFGGDKHAAMIDDHAMIDHVVARLAAQCDAVVVVGRAWPGLTDVADAPAPGLGPLGALAGALAYAQASGFDLVLTSGCDLPDIPLDLATRLSPAPAVVAGQPLLGLWPSASADRLIEWLVAGEDRAMRAWIARMAARRVALAADPANINTQADLARYVAGFKPPADPRSSR